MATQDPTRYPVDDDDAQRLTRLSEEVRARLTEMAFIAARVTGTKYDGGGIAKFVPREALRERAANAPETIEIEIVEIFPGFDCCYGTFSDGSMFFDCPCHT
jgi:hypothetical protein